MHDIYKNVIRWALHQGLGTIKGEAVFQEILPIIDLAETATGEAPAAS